MVNTIFNTQQRRSGLRSRRHTLQIAAISALTVAAGLVSMTSCGAQKGESKDAPIAFRIDATQNRTPISPYIYGTNHGEMLASVKGTTLVRVGGNLMTPYNWKNNASNAGSDYFQMNTDVLGGGNVFGEVIRGNIVRAFANNASIIITVPIGGYVAADKTNDGDVAKTPDYLHARFDESRARKGKPFTYPPDPTSKTVYQDEMAAWVETAFPDAHKNTAKTIFYALDNEPDLWNHTHPRIHPQPETYADLLNRSIEYSAAIKAVAPNALIFGPVSYGWQGYQNLQNAPDANGRNFLDSYLDGMKQAERAQGKRLLDVLDLHWYPEAYGGGQRALDAVNAPPATVEARLQAPRSLWDPTYKEDSWIAKNLNGPVRLIPRLKEQIARHYPGTKLAFTEYCYGGTDEISGGIAQADALGIFGREGVFAACWFRYKGNGAFISGAFAAFRNYDGRGGHVGDTCVKADTDDAARTSVYASVDSADPKRMYVVALNKTDHALYVDMALKSPAAYAQADVYQFTGKSPSVQPAGEAQITGGHLAATLPPMSVSTFALHP